MLFLFFVVFSLIGSTHSKEIHFNPEGIYSITKTVFKNHINDQNIHEVFCFAQGLTDFCKEKGVQQDELIGEINKVYRQKDNIKDACTVVDLKLKHQFFPQEAFFLDIKKKRHEKIVKHEIIATLAMKQFIHDMIEKGKSVNQNQAPN